MFPYVLAGCALGTAEGALEGYVAATRRRVGSYSGARVADHVPIQIKIAEAAVRIEAAGTLMRAVCDEAMAHGGGRHGARFHDEDPLPPQRRPMPPANAAARWTSCSRRAAVPRFTSTTRSNGSSAISTPSTRTSRFNFDIAGAQYGRAVLGLEEGGGLPLD